MADTEEETQTYTIKSVNTGLQGENLTERVGVKVKRGELKEYGSGDQVELTEIQFESLKNAGVKFESNGSDDDDDHDNQPDQPGTTDLPDIGGYPREGGGE